MAMGIFSPCRHDHLYLYIPYLYLYPVNSLLTGALQSSCPELHCTHLPVCSLQITTLSLLLPCVKVLTLQVLKLPV